MDRQTERALELLLGIISIGGFALWLNFAFIHQDLPAAKIFLHYSFILFIGSLTGSTALGIHLWKSAFKNAERAIYEIVIYRKMTPINGLARKLGISRDAVFGILNSMLKSHKIAGRIENGIYYSFTPRTPVCPICGEKITEPLRLIVCPICYKPFHKDHIIGYLNEVKQECPNCHNPLTLADLYLDEDESEEY